MSIIIGEKKKDQKKETLCVFPNEPLRLSDSLNPPASSQTSLIHTRHFVEG